MADQKISQLTSYTPPIPTDVFPIVDVTSGTTKKITVANLSSYLAALTETLTNKTITAPIIATIVNGAGTLTLPSSTDTLVGRATTDTLTNKTISKASNTLTGVAGSGANSDITSLSSLSTPLTVAQGGTGLGTLTANNVILGNGTSNVTFVAPGSSGNVLTSNGSTWVSSAPAAGAVYKNGTTTYDISTASGTQNIAHGLGATPKFVRLTVFLGTTAGGNDASIGTYNGTTNSCVYYVNAGSFFAVGAALDNTYGVFLTRTSGSNFSAKAIITFDGTNIILTWTKTGTPTGTAQILWEAIG